MLVLDWGVMKVLRFAFSEISPEQLHRHLANFRGPVKGSFIQFQRRDAENSKYHFYTFTDGAVLQRIMKFLKSHAVKFTVVEEETLPSYARMALKEYRRAGGTIKNH